MSILNTNKLTWFKDGGEPLKSGYVYVGQPGLDPQVPANQKTVTFTDSQGNSFTAPQPLRTDVNGRVQWNGKAIIATVEGDYSLLILNSSQTQITDGWTPTVEGDSSAATDLGDYREYGLLLADIKKVDVSPGQTIGSIGKTSATDDLGANWLVVSPTGGTADDIDLIDFDNGLQGERLRNFLQPQDDLDNLNDNEQARTNIGLIYTQQVFESSGTWTKPSGCRYVKVECIGGGGGSGGVTGNANPSINAGSGGGGGGGYASSVIDVTATASEGVTIGAGGGAGANGATSGSSGGATAFGTSVIANGGTGSAGHTAGSEGSHAGGDGGQASSSTGDVKSDGSHGGIGFTDGLIFYGGTGGATALGGTSSTNTDGSVYGGGAGGKSTFSAGDTPGRNGGNGVCIVTEYY